MSVHQPWRRRSTLKQTLVGSVLAVGELVAASLSQPGSVFDPKYYMATFLTEATISYPPTRLLSGRDAIGRESWSGLPQHCPVCCHKTFVVKDLLRRCANCDHILPMEFDEKLKAPPRPSARAIRMFTKTPAEDPDLPHLLPPPRLYNDLELTRPRALY